jgi:hypothetical protein
MPAGEELPVRIIDQPGGAILRCLCGLEAARLVKSTANYSMIGLRSSGPARHAVGADLSPAAVLAMVLHARGCERGRAALGPR